MDQKTISGLTMAELLKFALLEDLGDGDHTSLSTIQSKSVSKAIVKVKETGIIAGILVAEHVLQLVDQEIIAKAMARDGDVVTTGQIAMELEGNTRALLRAERILLNCMQRMSGIASLTRKYVDAISGTNSKILDTRKTTPNFRLFEKWAVLSGGGTNHRFGLYDMILIKDNHVDAAGGIVQAIRKANKYIEETGKNLQIEIETRNLEEVRQVISEGNVQRIMLDNFGPALLKEAIELIKGNYVTEASGGIVLENVRDYALTGVNFISVGALTHSYKSLDISMKLIS
ncbi:MAG: carboxylating nicotinate-nucleotide diphosphorylase [Bacteroidia bacterium]|nr:carboxylating nicotinate-nucleotide diphosphorylase [Bacteroidia bacterium]